MLTTAFGFRLMRGFRCHPEVIPRSPLDFDHIAQGLSRLLTESPTLTRFIILAATPKYPSELPTLSHSVETARRRTPAEPTRQNVSRELSRAFRGPRFQSISLTHWLASPCMARLAKSRLAVAYPAASSSDAVTRLSYPGTHRACARWC